MKLFGVILLACIALGSCEDSALSSSRIVGGTAAIFNNFNYVVQLRRDHFGTGTWHQQCGGVIIRPRLVLTSAHCFDEVPHEFRWRVNAGTNSRLIAGQERLVLNIYRNEFYNQLTLQNNLAIVILLTPLTYALNVGEAILPPATAILPIGNVQVLGWGASVLNGIPNEFLQVATVPVVANLATCISSYANVHRFVGNDNICVGGAAGICMRDEGGPLVQTNVVHGIASFVFQCGMAEFPSVFTRIVPFVVNFINPVIASFPN